MRYLSQLVRQAKKDARFTRIAFYGPSNSGKTVSSLKVARTFGGRFLVVDNETRGDPPVGSSNLYANIKCADGSPFDVIDLVPPYAPELLEQIPDLVRENGYTTVIVDSFSRFWNDDGGFLSKLEGQQKTDKFGGWSIVGPIYQRVFDKLMSTPAHVIMTMRVKTSYVEDTNERGKKVHRKLGLAPVARNDTIYAFDFAFSIDEANVAKPEKVRDESRRYFYDPSTDEVLLFPRPGEELARKILDCFGENNEPSETDALVSKILSCATLDELKAFGESVLKTKPPHVKVALKRPFLARQDVLSKVVTP